MFVPNDGLWVCPAGRFLCTEHVVRKREGPADLFAEKNPSPALTGAGEGWHSKEFFCSLCELLFSFGKLALDVHRACGSLPTPSKPVVQALHVGVEHRSDVERQQLREHQAADHR